MCNKNNHWEPGFLLNLNVVLYCFYGLNSIKILTLRSRHLYFCYTSRKYAQHGLYIVFKINTCVEIQLLKWRLKALFRAKQDMRNYYGQDLGYLSKSKAGGDNTKRNLKQFHIHYPARKEFSYYFTTVRL